LFHVFSGACKSLVSLLCIRSICSTNSLPNTPMVVFSRAEVVSGVNKLSDCPDLVAAACGRGELRCFEEGAPFFCGLFFEEGSAGLMFVLFPDICSLMSMRRNH
jgi:hypothetical protein